MIGQSIVLLINLMRVGTIFSVKAFVFYLLAYLSCKVFVLRSI